MRQKLGDLTRPLRRQAYKNILEVCIRIMPIEPRSRRGPCISLSRDQPLPVKGTRLSASFKVGDLQFL